MTERTASLINIPSIGRVERSGLAVTAILMVVCYFIGSSELAVGAAAGGILFTANFTAIRFLVHALVGKSHTKGFGIFAFVIKMAVFIAIVVALFLFAKVNLYGFFIGVTGVVIVIIGESLRGSKDGTL
ncbi:MAG TPA: ATP synthase subunit I [Thermodesulfobacteriota bacterium]|nr:ATP synthase subunit I [Thermodesulfobacteriota bacterium]